MKVVPCQGYRHDTYRDKENNSSIPVVMAAASREILFGVFMDLLEPLGGVVNVVLETSHNRVKNGHLDLYREHIDMPVLKSVLWEYEQLLLNDGCTGIAVLNPDVPQEVQFDEHKILIVYSEDLGDIKFITEAEHVHSSSGHYSGQFEELKVRLGVDSVSDRVVGHCGQVTNYSQRTGTSVPQTKGVSHGHPGPVGASIFLRGT